MNISAEDEDFLESVRNELRAANEGVTSIETSANGLDAEDDQKEETKSAKKDTFEVPEFLYKFSSTFFKKASSKDKKIFKIFGKVNKEKAKIRTERLHTKGLGEDDGDNGEEMDPEMGDYGSSNVLNRSFKRVNTHNSDIKLKLNPSQDKKSLGKKAKKRHHR